MELFDEHVAVSLRGRTTARSRPLDARAEDRTGTLLVMTSPAGIEGSATLPLYATMKGALRGFAKSLGAASGPRRHHGQRRVTVGVLARDGHAIAEDPTWRGGSAGGCRSARRRSRDRRRTRGRVPGGPDCGVHHRPDARHRRRPLHEHLSDQRPASRSTSGVTASKDSPGVMMYEMP